MRFRTDNTDAEFGTLRTYQAALNDPTYWEPEGREKNQQQVGEAFDRLVQLTNTILGDTV